MSRVMLGWGRDNIYCVIAGALHIFICIACPPQPSQTLLLAILDLEQVFKHQIEALYLHIYMHATRSDQPVCSSSLISVNAKRLWLFTCMTIGIQHHLFLQIFSDVSHTRENKFTHVFPQATNKSSEGFVISQPRQLNGESIFPAGQLAITAWLQFCRCHQMLPPSLVLSWRCFCLHISFKLLFTCKRLSTVLLENSIFSSESNLSSLYVTKSILRTIWQNDIRTSHYLPFPPYFPQILPVSISHILHFLLSAKKAQNLKCISFHPNGHSIWEMTFRFSDKEAQF